MQTEAEYLIDNSEFMSRVHVMQQKLSTCLFDVKRITYYQQIKNSLLLRTFWSENAFNKFYK